MSGKGRKSPVLDLTKAVPAQVVQHQNPPRSLNEALLYLSADEELWFKRYFSERRYIRQPCRTEMELAQRDEDQAMLARPHVKMAYRLGMDEFFESRGEMQKAILARLWDIQQDEKTPPAVQVAALREMAKTAAVGLYEEYARIGRDDAKERFERLMERLKPRQVEGVQ